MVCDMRENAYKIEFILVLILILLEYGLRLTFVLNKEFTTIDVLILILLEYGLRLKLTWL